MGLVCIVNQRNAILIITFASVAIALKAPDAAAYVTSGGVGTQRILMTRILSTLTFINICTKNKEIP